MQPIEFSQQTFILAKNQPQYIPLPVHAGKYREHTVPHPILEGVMEKVMLPDEITACFELSPEEIGEICRTGKLWYTQCIFGNQFQPVRLSTQNPFEGPSFVHNPINQVQGWPDDVVREVQLMLVAAIGTTKAHNIMMHLVEKLKPVVNLQPQAEKSPIADLVKALQEDQEYWQVWSSNIAGAFLNAWQKLWPMAGTIPAPTEKELLLIGTNAADNFISQLCEAIEIVNEKPAIQ
jgi:hypothetical protein